MFLDRYELRDAQLVEALQEPLLEGLRISMIRRQPAEAFDFTKLLMVLVDLRCAAAICKLIIKR